MKPILGKYNTLRNQILIVYLMVMMLVLLLVGGITYIIVVDLIKDKAEKQMQQTALQATGRMASLYQQIDNTTIQVATNAEVQQLLEKDTAGKRPTFKERQQLMERMNKLQIYSDGIASIQLYTKDFNRVVPLDNYDLTKRVDEKWIKQAEREEGGLVWIGRDPNNPNFFLAIRQVSLLNQSFSSGGYLLVQMNSDYFQLMNSGELLRNEDYMIVLDQNGNIVTTNYPRELAGVFNESIIPIDGNDFMVVKEKSEKTGWTLVILTPVKALMEGVSLLRTATFLTGIFGFIIFVILSYFLSTMITRPIFKLTRVMKHRNKGELILNSELSSTVEIEELNHAYNQMADEINHLIQVVYEKELLRSQTELKALQSQINPHFLFNTLNAIYWSLEGNDEEELAELIITLSELFRYTIDSDSNSEWVTIKQELNHIEKYMQIMKFRLEHVTWNITVPKEYENVKIPKLLIQPLVENAIIHGISKKIESGIVTVIIEKSNTANRLLCKVIDNGQGMDVDKVNMVNKQIKKQGESNPGGTGIALENVNKRLRLYYKNDNVNGVTIRSELTTGTCCSFEIPLNGGNGDAEGDIDSR